MILETLSDSVLLREMERCGWKYKSHRMPYGYDSNGPTFLVEQLQRRSEPPELAQAPTTKEFIELYGLSDHIRGSGCTEMAVQQDPEDHHVWRLQLTYRVGSTQESEEVDRATQAFQRGLPPRVEGLVTIRILLEERE